MEYKTFLNTMTGCPFCSPEQSRVVTENEHAFLTYAIAPYHEHHLLVIPKRHVEDFTSIVNEETKSLESLLHTAATMLHTLGYTNYTLLLRNGDATNKSIPHLHYHVIPTVVIGDLTHLQEERTVLSAHEREVLIQEMRACLPRPEILLDEPPAQR